MAAPVPIFPAELPIHDAELPAFHAGEEYGNARKRQAEAYLHAAKCVRLSAAPIDLTVAEAAENHAHNRKVAGVNYAASIEYPNAAPNIAAALAPVIQLLNQLNNIVNARFDIDNARRHNSNIGHAAFALHALPRVNDGQLPAEFPTTHNHISNLTDVQLDELQQFYGVQFQGEDLQTRRAEFRGYVTDSIQMNCNRIAMQQKADSIRRANRAAFSRDDCTLRRLPRSKGALIIEEYPIFINGNLGHYPRTVDQLNHLSAARLDSLEEFYVETFAGDGIIARRDAFRRYIVGSE